MNTNETATINYQGWTTEYYCMFDLLVKHYTNSPQIDHNTINFHRYTNIYNKPTKTFRRLSFEVLFQGSRTIHKFTTDRSQHHTITTENFVLTLCLKVQSRYFVCFVITRISYAL